MTATSNQDYTNIPESDSENAALNPNPEPWARLRDGGSLTVHPDGRSYNYSYGPKGLAGLFSNQYTLWCVIFASIGGLSFGYDQGVIANVLVMKDFTERWPISPFQEGLMTAILELGALTGSVLSIFVACVVFCIGSVFQCGAWKLYHIFIGRAVGGFRRCRSLSMLSPLYMAEISPPELRGSLMALEQFAIVLGVVCGFWIGFFTRSTQHLGAVPLGIQIVPGIILFLQGRYEEALASLAKLRRRTPIEAKRDPLIQIELLEMRVEATLLQRISPNADDLKPHGNLGELGSWGALFTKKYRARTAVGVLMMVFQQWSGINALLYYGPILVKSIGLSGEKVTLLVSGGIGVVQFFAVIPAISQIDRIGRKSLLRGGGAVMACSHFAIAILRKCICTFTASYGVSFGPIGWVLPSEVFPLSIRSKGVALSTASNWTNNFLIGLVTPVLVEYSAATFMIFSTACFLAYLWATYSVPETANVSLEEIDAVFGTSSGQDDELVRQQVGLREIIRDFADT
ncbi:MFS monosaccharide transporter [Desarmillaria tabescens]|uniref:MFS monosaccharide transporter n=1 Tax=Armillaria tabescens TaxID=1929756 RepID=A0AA39MKS0_ARMTA|nr:MFS monosaccharide transporter [Desarmillaria tabescens]KAK0437942.1 MFS monosaccharide transporter [Desarmillaria tabescens]